MPKYHYTAEDTSGRKVEGDIEAVDLTAAGELLAREGFTAAAFVPVEQNVVRLADAPVRLGSSDTEEVLAHFAQVGMSLAPLADGLRAAAAEATNRRVASALRYLASEIEQGRKPEDVLGDATLRMPAHVRGLIASATRTGSLGPALDELIEFHRSFRVMFWSIVGSIAYPFTVLLLSVVVLVYLLAFVVPPFEALFTDFELALPTATTSLLHASRTTTWLVYGPAKWVLVFGLIVVLFALYITATGHGGMRAQRLLEMMPLIGPIWSWAGAAGFMQLLATMLEQGIPLPEALRYTADAMKKADLRHAGFWLAGGIERGETLSALVESSNCLPATSVPILRWGEQTGSLAEAARTLSSLFAERVDMRTAWLRSASPPMVYLFVVIALGFAVMSLFLPMISLIQGLS
jgi:type IV pilus assembly protein PilC